MFGAELAFKEPSKALYALANTSCLQSGTSRSFPFSRRSSTREKTGKDGVTRHGKRRQEKHFLSLHLLFCSICCFPAAFSHSTSFPFLGAFNAHEFVFARGKSRMQHFIFYRFAFSAVFSLFFSLSLSLRSIVDATLDLHAERKSQKILMWISYYASYLFVCMWEVERGPFNKTIMWNSYNSWNTKLERKLRRWSAFMWCLFLDKTR